MHVGFIGLGIMGRPMAMNLVKAGHDLVVYNRTREKCRSLAEAGAKVAASPRDVARGSEIIVVIVSDTPDTEQVLFGENGVIEGIGPGKLVIDMSTISPTASMAFAARLTEKGAEMMDAPVSGGQKGAESGTLSIMVGGGKEAFERCLPILEAMGKTVVHVGENGHGLLTKMVNQVTGSITILAMVECVRLIVRSGIDPEKALEVVCGGAARSGMLENYPLKVLAGDFSPGFKISLMNKDLRLASELVESLGLVLPTFEKVREVFQQSEEASLGELGVQGVYKYFEDRG